MGSFLTIGQLVAVACAILFLSQVYLAYGWKKAREYAQMTLSLSFAFIAAGVATAYLQQHNANRELISGNAYNPSWAVPMFLTWTLLWIGVILFVASLAVRKFTGNRSYKHTSENDQKKEPNEGKPGSYVDPDIGLISASFTERAGTPLDG